MVFSEAVEMLGWYIGEYLYKALKTLGSISITTNTTIKKEKKIPEMCMSLTVAFSPPKVLDHYSASQIYLRSLFVIGIAHEGFSYPFCSKCHRVLLFLLCIFLESAFLFFTTTPPLSITTKLRLNSQV